MARIAGFSKTEIWKINLKDIAKNNYPLEVIEYLAEKKYKKSDSFWYLINILYRLDDNFISKFDNEVTEYVLDYFIKYQEISDRFIKKYLTYMPIARHWFSVSKHQSLSENFIREFKDQVYWGWISEYQNLSEKFMIEFIDKIKIGSIRKVYILKGEHVFVKDYGIRYNIYIPDDVKDRIIALKKVRNA